MIKIRFILLFLSTVIFLVLLIFVYQKYQQLTVDKTNLKNSLSKLNKDYLTLKKEDQYQINQELKKQIADIKTGYQAAVIAYEGINDLKSQKQNTDELDKQLAKALNFLSELNYASGEGELKLLTKKIIDLTVSTSPSHDNNLVVNNAAPNSGLQWQKVKTDDGEFTVAIVAGDLNSTRVIVDTSSENTCTSNCPALSLNDYISRNNAYAGINGSYFCPVSYPSCAGKENSFDTLLMNKNKVYFNSDNNVYSTVPAVIFSGNSSRFIAKSLEWGRDTSVDAVFANQPLLVFGGNVVFNGDDEPKRSGKGTRNFIGGSANMAYIGSIFNATTAEAAKVIKTLGIQNAINLDTGGSTALWANGGFQSGPGRAIPNAILFLRK